MMPKKATQQKTTKVHALLARTRFGQLLDRVTRNHERFVVTKKGKATAVILRIEDDLATLVKAPASLAALQKEAQENGMVNLTWEEIETEIEMARQERARREA